ALLHTGKTDRFGVARPCALDARDVLVARNRNNKARVRRERFSLAEKVEMTLMYHVERSKNHHARHTILKNARTASTSAAIAFFNSVSSSNFLLSRSFFKSSTEISLP